MIPRWVRCCITRSWSSIQNCPSNTLLDLASYANGIDPAIINRQCLVNSSSNVILEERVSVALIRTAEAQRAPGTLRATVGTITLSSEAFSATKLSDFSPTYIYPTLIVVGHITLAVLRSQMTLRL